MVTDLFAPLSSPLQELRAREAVVARQQEEATRVQEEAERKLQEGHMRTMEGQVVIRELEDQLAAAEQRSQEFEALKVRAAHHWRRWGGPDNPRATLATTGGLAARVGEGKTGAPAAGAGAGGQDPPAGRHRPRVPGLSRAAAGPAGGECLYPPCLTDCWRPCGRGLPPPLLLNADRPTAAAAAAGA